MAGNNVKINLLFQADTTAAVANMQQLGKTLNDISRNTTIGIDNGAMQKAVQSAQQLQIHLQNAVNVNTGKLDLNKLNTSLKSSGQSLQTLTTNLQAAGPAGQQAFIKVATAVASAEAPMVRVNKRLKDFGVTLANTVKWQIASSAVHSLSGMLSSAVGHAEDLNKALNDIRIVTGYSTTTMAQFADRASSAAKELSTTTTEYAKAALIFYQQGLSNTDVDERASVVIKLAQVTGESAQTVSDQMTAIWNNFDDGTHSLEYYADALTKLGAATAASTDEISAGLEKFASIAKTVGLSYDTAAAAVATVVDKTRESADVVGTAFKTIFGRMQGLQLGETLEDGVDLNKYSEALESVGVQVLTAEGEVRKMDDILDDLGEKWQGFGESTKIAIAQTVGGMRQYNQMMALMENWDAVEKNIELATNATGELSKQQDIWAESYEAAAQRVKQAQNELYESFIDDESIITINNLIADLISSVGNLIDAFGGIGPVLLTVGLLFSKTIIPLIGNGIKSVSNAISVWSGKAAQEVMGMQNQMQAQITNTMNKSGFSEGVRQQLELSRQLIGVKQQLTLSSKSMTMAEQEEAAARIQMYEAMVAETQQLLAKKAAMEEELRVLKLKATTETPRSQKRNVATKTTTEQFRADNADRDPDEVNDIVEEASTRSLGETRGELQSLEQQTATQEQRLADKKFELAKVRQQIASHEQELEKKLEQNTSSGWNTKDGQHHLEALETAQKREKELTAEIAEIADEDYSGRIERLHEVIELQKEIQKNTDQETEEMSHGKVKSEIFANTLNESGSDVGGYTSSMADKAISKIGGEMTAEGGVSVDASIVNIEKLFGVIGQYKTQLAEITAVQQDFKTAEQEVAAAFTEMNNAMKPEEIAAAQQELADANMEVKSKTEALVAAEEKLAQERAKGPKNARNIAKAQKEVKSASEAVQKAQDKLTKTFAKQPEAFKKVATAQKAILDSEDKYMELARAAGASEEEIKQLASAFEKFKKSGNPADLKTLTSTLKNMKIATADTVSGLDGLANEMRNMMVAAGMSPDKIDPIINKLRELSNQAPQVQTGLRGVGDEGASLGAKFAISATSISSALTSIATAAGQLSMGISGINALVNAFDEGNTPMETFMGILTGITMIAPVVSGLFKKIADAKKKDTAETTANTIATVANTAAESGSIIAKGAKTVATWLLNAALAVQKILENPVAGAIIVGVALAAAAAIAIKTKAVEKQNEELRKNNEENMKNAESTNDLSAAWADQMSTMDNLIAKYRKLDQASEDYQQTVEDIIDAVPDLIDAYSQLAEGLDLTAAEQEEFNKYVREMKEAAAVGDVEAIAETQTKMDNLLSPKAAEEAKSGADAAMNLTAQAMAEEGGAKFKNNKVTRHVGGTSTKTVYDENGNKLGGEEQVSVDILNKHGVGTKTGARGFDVELDASDSGKFLEDYEALMTAAEEMESTLGEHLDNSDTYREIKEMLDASKEQYEKLAEMQAEAEKYGVIDAKTNVEKSKEEGGLGYGIEDIDSLKEYNEYRQAMIDDIAGEDATAEEIAQAEAAVDAWLEAQGAVQEYTDAKHKLGYISTQVGKAAEEAAKAAGKSDEEAAAAAEEARAARQAELETFFDTLDADQQKFLLEVDFSKYQSEEAITAEIARLQNIADQDAIKVKIEAINTAQSSLKESGMTEEDWIGVRDSGIEWGKDGVMKFTEFLAMSYEEQSQYLERIKGAQEGLLETTTENSIADLQAGLAALDAAKNSGEYNGSTEQYEAERQAILDNIEALEGELAIRQKLAESKEIEEYGLDASLIQELKQEFNDVNSELQIFNEETGKLEDAALSVEDLNEANKDAAIRYARLNEAVDDLNSNYETYNTLLEDLSKATNDVDKAMIANSKDGKALQKSLAGLLGTTEDFIDADLLGAIDPKDFKKAAEGDEDAIERIRDAFIRLQAEANGIDFEGLKDELASLEEGVIVDINADSMPLLYELIAAKVAAGAGAAEIEALLSGFNIDADVSDFVGSMEEMAAASAQAGSEVIANTSFSQDVETVTAETPVTKEDVGFTESYTATPHTETSKILKNGADETTDVAETYYSWDKTITPTVQSETETNQTVGTSVNTSNAAGESGQVKGVQIKNAHKSSGGGVSSNRQGRATGGGGGGGGGGSTKKTSDSRKKKSEIVDRYKEVNDELEETNRLMTKNSTIAEGLYGTKRFAKLRENIKLMEQENKQLEKKYDLTLKYLEEDKQDLIDAASDAGISFTFDDNGNITNYTQQMTDLYNRREALLDSFGEEMDEDQQATLEELDNYIDALTEAYEQYETTLDEKKDAEEERLEKLLAIQEEYYNLLNEELEVKLSINEDDLNTLEYYLGKMSDDFYQMAEAAALMIGSGDTKGQLDVYKDNLADQEQYLKDLEYNHTTINPETGETYINDAQYIEGLRNSKDAIIENLNSLNDLDDAMMDYYGDTIAMAQDELAKYTDIMEHHSSVLSHYQTLLELTGKQNDTKAMGAVLEGQAKTAENRMKVAKDSLEMYQGQAEARYAEYQAALAAGDDAAAELYLEQYQAALTAANEAEEEFLSSAEEWAESLRAVLDNTMKGLAQDLENTLTGGTSFDQMTTAMERAASLQEDYLTTTNQIYETNKLMRSAQQEIDKTTNSVAKQRLKQFVSETEELQNKNKLSQYELDIQQAKYDLLLAEIALEEAQNAKSTVRLSRDSEGNFGYVYTADQSAVSDAEQNLADKQNALYNIGLEGANDYSQKYQQTLSEMYDTLTDLQNQKLEGMFESEQEYQDAVAAAKEYYYQKLADYSSLYSVALTTDSNVVADAWSTDFSDMMYQTEDWKTAVNDYIGQVQSAMSEYETQMDNIAEQTVGKDLDTITEKTEAITTANDALVETITKDGGVIDSIEKELTSVAELTGEYASLRQEILDLIETYEDMLDAIDNEVETVTEGDGDEGDPDSGNPDSGNPDSGNPDSGNPGDSEPTSTELNVGSTVKVKKTASKWATGEGIWSSVKGNNFKVKKVDGSKILIGDPCGPNYTASGITGWIKKTDLEGFDTGGYTGDWDGSYGKLAMLHKKELVLNEGDTDNFLMGMELLDKIVSAIDLYSMNSQLGGMLSSPAFGGVGESEVLEQQVHIEASFPGVQDRNEIEEAFNTLINRASQYAHRK